MVFARRIILSLLSARLTLVYLVDRPTALLMTILVCLSHEPGLPNRCIVSTVGTYVETGLLHFIVVTFLIHAFRLHLLQICQILQVLLHDAFVARQFRELLALTIDHVKAKVE